MRPWLRPQNTLYKTPANRPVQIEAIVTDRLLNIVLSGDFKASETMMAPTAAIDPAISPAFTHLPKVVISLTTSR